MINGKGLRIFMKEHNFASGSSTTVIATDSYTKEQFMSDITNAKNNSSNLVVEKFENNKSEIYITATSYSSSEISPYDAEMTAKKNCPSVLMYHFIWQFIKTKYPIANELLIDTNIQDKYTYTGAGVVVTGSNDDYSSIDDGATSSIRGNLLPHALLQTDADGITETHFYYDGTATCQIKLTDINIPTDGIVATFTISKINISTQ